MDLRNCDLEGKKVIIRCDFNVPIKDGVIRDDNRIVESLPTIKLVRDKKAKIILMSHLGRVETVQDKSGKSLDVVAKRLEELLGQKIIFVNETRGKKLEDAINSLNNGDILLMENTRFEDVDGMKESKNDPELGLYWSKLADFYVNDAFGTAHRSHASNVGIASHLPSCFGLLVKKELDCLKKAIDNPDRPLTVIVGGSKVTDKIMVLENLVKKADYILIGGGMAYTFLKASGYDIGCSIVDDECLDFCQNILNQYGDKIVLPVDNIVSCSLDSEQCEVKMIKDMNCPDMGLDIGPKTVSLFCQELKYAKRVIMNGPMGCFENFKYADGTKAIYDFITLNHIKTLIGGGDSASSVNKLSDPDKFYHISTGGGATLEYLEGKELPGISVIYEK